MHEDNSLDFNVFFTQNQAYDLWLITRLRSLRIIANCNSLNKLYG